MDKLNIEYDMNELLSAMTKGGLRTTKYRGSKAKKEEKGTQIYPGKVFGTRNKQDLKDQKGIIIGSLEALIDTHPKLTHITPNVYRSAQRLQDGAMKGHSENNLKQINVFAIDIDGIDKHEITMGDILLRGHEVGLVPTLILDTPNGYHVMYFLESPIYIKKTKRKERNVAIDIAKRISINLRKFYGEVIPGIDPGCNHFGYFRCPKQENIIDYRPNNQYTVADFIEFSSKFEEYHADDAMDYSNDTVLKYAKNIKDGWFHSLYNCTHIKGSDNQIGRDNAIFTMSLHCYASNMAKKDCLNLMQKFNSQLDEPLDVQTVEKKVNSAYSGKYYGASNRHIDALLYAWCEITNSRRNTFWFRKHAKKREDRVKSHYTEWERDLYLYVNQRAEKGYLVTTTSQVMNDLGIARSSLTDMLRESKKIFSSATRGKYAKLTLSTRKSLFQLVLEKVKEDKIKKQNYLKYIKQLLPDIRHELAAAMEDFLQMIEENADMTRIQSDSTGNTS